MTNKIERIKFDNYTTNLATIKSIDSIYYKDNTPPIEWYCQRYNDNNSICYGITDETNYNQLVGYIMGSTIRKELYNAICNGVLLNDIDINPEMFVDDSDYVYISSCVVKPKYRYNGHGSRLLLAILDYYKEKNICAITISNGGYLLTSKFMKEHLILPDNKYVFINKRKL